RARLDEAHGEYRLGRYAKALAIAKPALDQSRKAGYPPVTGEALVLVGTLQHELADRAGAATLDEALRVAAESGDERGIIESATALLPALTSDLARFEAAEEVATFAGATARHVRPSAELLAPLEASIGSLFDRRGRPDDAKAHLARAVELADHE